MFFILLASIISFFGTFLVMPYVIKLAIKNRILSPGGGRNVHNGFTPNIGGIAIFLGLLLSNLYLLLHVAGQNTSIDIDLDSLIRFKHYLIVSVSCIILFVTGILDDLSTLSSKFRLVIQLLVSVLLTYYADTRIESFSGLFGIYELPYLVSIVFSIVITIFIINSFNLTDGLDSLATTLGVFILSVFGVLFLNNNEYYDATLAFSAVASLCAFFFYNKPPAKIFMGDSGSLVIGLIISYCALKLCNLPINSEGTINPVFILCVLAYPSIDTLRVFVVRILDRKSPFTADRNHIHHLLVDKDFSHGWAAFFAVSYSIILSLICWFIRDYITLSFIFMVFLAITFIVLPMASFARSTTKKFLSFFK